MKFSFAVPLLLFTLVCPVSAADDLPATIMTERGKLLVSEDFTAARAQEGDAKHWGNWHFAVGKWETGEGFLRGTQVPEDHHPAHAALNVPLQDFVVQCEVRLDGCRMTRIRAADNDYLCSVLRLTPEGVSLYKDDHDHDGADKDELLGTLAKPFQAGEWHSLLLEIRGSEAVATLDGKSIAGSHSLIANKKQSLRFAVVGGSASYRKLRVWEALPSPNWEKNRQLLSAAEK